MNWLVGFALPPPRAAVPGDGVGAKICCGHARGEVLPRRVEPYSGQGAGADSAGDVAACRSQRREKLLDVGAGRRFYRADVVPAVVAKSCPGSTGRARR